MYSCIIRLSITLLVFYCFLQVATCDRSSLCNQIEDVFHAVCSADQTTSVTRLSVGAPGKSGPVGPRGELGPEGPPGEVDYDQIDAMINVKIASVEERCISDVEELEARLAAMQGLLDRSQEKVRALERREGACEVKFGGKCFWIVAHDHFISGYDKAVQWCAERGGTPGNIYSEEHYHVIMRYMRSKILSGLKWMHLWLGMRTIPVTGVATLSNGTRAPYVKWYPGNPTTNTDKTHMTIVQRIPSSNANTGIHNLSPSDTREGVLCEV